MGRRDLVSSLVFIGLAAIFMIGALRYGFGSFSRPGPGLMPFFASLMVIVLSGFIFFISLRKRKIKGAERERFLPPRGVTIRQMIGVLALFGYGIALESLGLTLTTALFMIIMLRFVGLKKNWVMILGTSFLTTLISYLLFVTLLKSALPKGIFL